jgi:alpha 1,3-glucosidase
LIDDTFSLVRAVIDFKETKSGVFVIDFGTYNSAVLTLSPFTLDVYCEHSLIASINKKGWLNFEHLRRKPESDSRNEQPQSDDILVENEGDNSYVEMDELERLKQKLSEGAWEETFHEHTDRKPRGPSSVGLDVTFVGSQHVYGIPEHASNLSLKTTRFFFHV